MTARSPTDVPPTSMFDDRFRELFGIHHPRIFRLLYRLVGDADLAADMSRATFARLHRRGSMPDHPEGWLVKVAIGLSASADSSRSGRRSAPTTEQAADDGSAPPGPAVRAAAEQAKRVRAALASLPERERAMLLLRAEGYSWRDIAAALDVREPTIGNQLAVARRAFLDAWKAGTDAS